MNMKRIAVISLLLLLPLTAAAQSVPAENTLKLYYNRQSQNPGTLLLIPLPRPSLPISLAAPGIGTVVSYNLYTQQYRPTVPEFSANRNLMLTGNSGHMSLYNSGGFGISVTGSQRNYTSLGYTNMAGIGYSYTPAERITFYGSVYATDNMFHMTPFKEAGISGGMRVKVADRLHLKAYGQYSAFSTYRGQDLPPGMFPATYFGGSVELKVTDRFGMEGGAFREYNPFNRTWETHYFAVPVFY